MFLNSGGDDPATDAEGVMAYVFLLIAALFEVAWAVGLKYAQGFTKLWPSVLTITAMVISMSFLALARPHDPGWNGLRRLDGHWSGWNGDSWHRPVRRAGDGRARGLPVVDCRRRDRPEVFRLIASGFSLVVSDELTRFVHQPSVASKRKRDHGPELASLTLRAAMSNDRRLNSRQETTEPLVVQGVRPESAGSGETWPESLVAGTGFEPATSRL